MRHEQQTLTAFEGPEIALQLTESALLSLHLVLLGLHFLESLLPQRLGLPQSLCNSSAPLKSLY